MSYVWLAERSSAGPGEVLGVFSKPERARQVCQDSANGYFGAERTSALRWVGDDGYRSASHHDPGSGNVLFQVTRFTVDEEVTS